MIRMTSWFPAQETVIVFPKAPFSALPDTGILLGLCEDALSSSQSVSYYIVSVSRHINTVCYKSSQYPHKNFLVNEWYD